MGATNTTTYYNLSQFIGTDKPAWLQDYNGDMLKIDTAINNAKLAADSAANAASAAQNDATTALGNFATLNTTVGTLSNTVGTAVGNINTINSLIGNGTPTTTDQTIIGAINELHTDVQTLNNNYVIESMNNVLTITADGVKDYKTLMSEAISAMGTLISGLGTNEAIRVNDVWIGSYGNWMKPVRDTVFYSGDSATSIEACKCIVTATYTSNYYVILSAIAGDCKLKVCDIDTTPSVVIAEKEDTAPSSGTLIRIGYDRIIKEVIS